MDNLSAALVLGLLVWSGFLIHSMSLDRIAKAMEDFVDLYEESLDGSTQSDSVQEGEEEGVERK